MPPIRCMFWNVRNLSQELFRPGRRSRQFTIQQKIRSILRAIRTGSFDLVVLLETGADAHDIFVEFRGGLPQGFNIFRSDLTPNAPGGETYLVISRPGLAVNSLFPVPVGGPNPNFFGNQGPRQPLGFEVRIPANPNFRPQLICWHAPSSAMSRANRRATLIAAVNDLNGRLDPNRDTLFFGDLNFESGEQADLNGALVAPWNHLGPNDGAGNRALTSLRQFQNIIRNNQPGSQPYDQAWERLRIPAPATGFTFQDCDVLPIGSIAQVVYGHLDTYIRRQVLIGSFKAAQSFKSIPTRDRSNVLMRTYRGGEISAQVNQCIQLTLDIIPDSFALSQQNNNPQWKKAMGRVRYAQNELKNLKVLNHDNEQSSAYSPFEVAPSVEFLSRRATRSKCERILKGMKDLNKALLLLHSYLNNLTGVHQSIDLSAYEYAISDHLPVTFTYG